MLIVKQNERHIDLLEWLQQVSQTIPRVRFQSLCGKELGIQDKWKPFMYLCLEMVNIVWKLVYKSTV